MLAKLRFERILGLSLPMIGGMVSQNILNLVDTAMVSRTGDSDAALAAVGYGGFAVFVCQSLLLGLATGVQASASRRKGEGRTSETALFLNAALLLVAIGGPLIALVSIPLAPAVFPYISPDPRVVMLAVPYLQIRLLGVVFVGMNFAFRGYWNAIDLTRLYLATLVVMHTVNIFLNYVLIFGHFGAPALGVTGAGIASVISIALGTAIYFVFGLRHARAFGFLQALPSIAAMRRLIAVSLPSSIQQMFFSAGFLVLFLLIGMVGTTEVAAANVLINVMLVALLPGIGFGLAAATLVGQALGRGDVDDAAEWAWDVVKVALIGLILLGVPMVACPGLILSTVYELEPATLETTLWPMRIVGLGMAVEALAMVLQHALQGAGDTRRVMLVAIVGQWFVILPLVFLIGPVLGFGLTAIWLVQSAVRLVQATVFVQMWRARAWATVTV